MDEKVSDSQTSNKRIVKNTLFLYFRMAIIMLVKLYTSRVLLEVLGVDDYGVWNVVAAFVVAFSFISSPLVTATQRFLNFDMGKGGHNLNAIFNISLELFFVIAVVVVIVLETFGLWFVNHKMNFPPGSMDAVNWVFQFTIFTLFVNLLRMPYESTIIAYERMSFYAIVSLVEAFLLLAIVFMLKIHFAVESLIVYGALTFISAILIFVYYQVYCSRRFECVKLKLCWDKNYLKEIGTFSGWNLFGACSSMTATQGVNVLLNIFCGVAVNAAYGISMQINNAVSTVVYNLQKASNPQIVKSYSSGDNERVQDLVRNVGLYSFLLVVAFAVPMIFNMNYILHLWLGNNVPTYTSIFASFTLVQFSMMCFGGPMDTAVFATGKIKGYQVTLSIIIMLNVIFAYLVLALDMVPYWVMAVKCGVEGFILFARVVYMKKMIGLDICSYIRKVFGPISAILIIILAGMYGIDRLTAGCGGLEKLLKSTGLFIPIYILSVWLFAFDSTQRLKIKKMFKSKFMHG